MPNYSKSGMQLQLRLEGKDIRLLKPYSYGAYNKVRGKKQRIRITEGCIHDCPYCYEPTELRIFGIPNLERNIVEIMDMNLLCKPEALEIIRELGSKKVNGKVVRYNLMCGIDHRFLTQEIAVALKQSRFTKIRLAWDWYYTDQRLIRKAILLLILAGYIPNDLMVFMICNWKIPYSENCLKLDLCKVWNVQVADCYFDGQVFPHVTSRFWSESENRSFRKRVRKHNQLVNFKIDPEVH